MAMVNSQFYYIFHSSRPYCSFLFPFPVGLDPILSYWAFVVHQVHSALKIRCVSEAVGHFAGMRGLKMIQKGTPVTTSGGTGYRSKEASASQNPN